MDGSTAPVVVKLGGSLAHSPLLRDWLNELAQTAGPFALVPGGGPFADAVRSSQAIMTFSHTAAHRMALLAMVQYAYALTDMEPRFPIATGTARVAEVLRQGRTPIWAPIDILDGVNGIPETWDVTSDSLAAWLAERLRSRTLILIKRERPPETMPALQRMADAGVVDAAFPAFAKAGNLNVLWLWAGDPSAFAAAIAGARS